MKFLGFVCQEKLPSMTDVWQGGRTISMCGLGAMLLALELARQLGKGRARLLKYAVGSDICERGLPDQTGFASLVFE